MHTDTLRKRKGNTSSRRSSNQDETSLKQQQQLARRSANTRSRQLRRRLPGGMFQKTVTDLVDATFQDPWKLFFLLCCFRILNVFLIQSFFDPDEYWQTLEPAYCAVFRPSLAWDCEGYTWEWKRRATGKKSISGFLTRNYYGPVRSYLSVLPVHLFYWSLKTTGMDFHWLVARGPMFLSAVIVAAPIDMAVWYISDSRWALFVSMSSWFGAFCWVRTCTNSQEALLLVLALALMQKNGYHIWHRCAIAFFLGGISVSIRFTSLASFVPLGLLLTVEQKPRRKIAFLLGICVTFSLLGILTSAIVDRWFYGFWTLPFLGNLHFNAVLGMSTMYGTHPWYWYLLLGLPVVTGLLYPFLLTETYRWVSAFAAPFRERTRQQLWAIVITYTVALSTSSHKEFRFLLPVLPLLCILLESKVALFMKRKWSIRMILWVLPNVATLLYLGLFHQSGPISVTHDVVNLVVQTGQQNASLHLLLPCHTTPYSSYLHTRGGQHKFDVWHLECPPECRTTATCESDLLTTQPRTFLAEQYQKRAKPDFVITSTAYEHVVKDELGMLPLIRRFHAITGIHWDGTAPANNKYSFGGVTFLFDEMILMGRVDKEDGRPEIN